MVSSLMQDIPSQATESAVALVKDATHVFVYWDYSKSFIERFVSAGEPYSWEVRAAEQTREFSSEEQETYWTVQPQSTYIFEIFLKTEDGQTHPLGKSNQVTTPPQIEYPIRDPRDLEVFSSWGMGSSEQLLGIAPREE